MQESPNGCRVESDLGDGVERLTVTVTQAGTMLGISRTSAYERVGHGEIPTVRLGRRLVVPIAGLMGMLEGERPASTSDGEAA